MVALNIWAHLIANIAAMSIAGRLSMPIGNPDGKTQRERGMISCSDITDISGMDSRILLMQCSSARSAESGIQSGCSQAWSIIQSIVNFTGQTINIGNRYD
jgi:hypothetical protein